MKKISQVRKLYRNERIICEKYHDAILCFSSQLSTSLKYHIPEETFFQVKKFFLNEIYYQIPPFRVWNHLFMCKRSQFCVDMRRSCMNMCRNCVKLYVLNKIVSDYIAKNLYVKTDYFFLPEISDGIATAKKIHLFARTNSVSSKENLFSLNLCGF